MFSCRAALRCRMRFTTRSGINIVIRRFGLPLRGRGCPLARYVATPRARLPPRASLAVAVRMFRSRPGLEKPHEMSPSRTLWPAFFMACAGCERGVYPGAGFSFRLQSGRDAPPLKIQKNPGVAVDIRRLQPRTSRGHCNFSMMEFEAILFAPPTTAFRRAKK